MQKEILLEDKEWWRFFHKAVHPGGNISW